MAERYRPDQPTLCWECKNTNRYDCPWFDPADPQPVPGWVAEPREMYSDSTTYLVKECPKFEPEPPREAPAPPPGENVPGVRWRKTPGGGSWEARIMHCARNYSLGCFPSKEEAIAARRSAERAIARGEEPQHHRRADRPAGLPPGVYPGKRNWHARIQYRGRVYSLGYFKTMEQAIAARRAAEEAIKRGEAPCKNK